MNSRVVSRGFVPQVDSLRSQAVYPAASSVSVGHTGLRLVAVVICDDVLTNAAGRVTLYSVFHDLYADTYPAEVVRLHVVTTWLNTGTTPETVTARVAVLSPDGQELVGDAAFTFTVGPCAYHTQISRFRSLVFPAAGIYRVQVQMGTEVVADLSLALVAAGAANVR